MLASLVNVLSYLIECLVVLKEDSKLIIAVVKMSKWEDTGKKVKFIYGQSLGYEMY